MKNWYLVRDGELVSTHMFKAFATKSALDGDLVLTRDEFAKKYGNWYVLHIVGLGITINSKHLTEKEAKTRFRLVQDHGNHIK
jgi:hypothetical protein